MIEYFLKIPQGAEMLQRNFLELVSRLKLGCLYWLRNFMGLISTSSQIEGKHLSGDNINILF